MSKMTKLSSAELENKALAGYNAHVGHTAVVRRILVNVGGSFDYRWLSSQAMVRVVPTPRYQVLQFACQDLITPVWTVHLGQPHPEIPSDALLTVHAKSYSADGRVHPGDVFARRADLVKRGAIAGTTVATRALVRSALSFLRLSTQ
ncbi:hypothetical protein [Paraburkholderia sp. BL10I2N1]|uniref:hypothetical protein n=1 Tax=Paraburkholderia sp. BL10I2N1 TaxID=1938796 RepID=UPI00106166C8|nr:hypothetical protein [Paraburkholderia sp. BL10I2N1]TDN62197.1 hypothetical protein B0G77_5736 [Paraburkholderia sp. BL10I2N1]